MKQFVVRAYDGEGMLDKRMEVRPRHLEGMERIREHVICAGYMKAAEQGDVYGCFNVGECYYHGKGVEQDAALAFEWYMKAADKGDMQSQVNVANAYYLGNGTGAAYWNGDGVEKNLEECGYPPRDYQSRGLLPFGTNLPPMVAMPRHSLPLAGS